MEAGKMTTLFVLVLIGTALAVAGIVSGCTKKAVIAEKPWIIIDVRTPEEFSTGHLKGAKNIPYENIGDKIGSEVKSKDASVLLYCRSGRRSGIAYETLKGMGYTGITNAGGYTGLRKRFWVE